MVQKALVMSTESDYIREFLAHMGIEADVQRDSSDQNLIVIETEQFNHRRAWIEAWFTLVEQTDKYSYFRERPRGTGQTM